MNVAKSINTRRYYSTQGKSSIRCLTERVLKNVPSTRNNDRHLTLRVQYTALVEDERIHRSKAVEDFISAVSTAVTPAHTSIRKYRRELEAEYPPTDRAVAETRAAHRAGAVDAESLTCDDCGSHKECPECGESAVHERPNWSSLN
jgi:hypothetical protein